jgi:hypothetical protein
MARRPSPTVPWLALALWIIVAAVGVLLLIRL